MALSRLRRGVNGFSYWPGFVDAMSSLLLVIIFLLSVFVLAQFFLSQEITGRDTLLRQLNAQVKELTELLSLERGKSLDLVQELGTLKVSLGALERERDGVLAKADELQDRSEAQDSIQGQLNEEKRISRQALNQVSLLNQQISALRRQIAALENVLEAAEQKNRQSSTKIKDLGKRLNLALAQRVQELSRYRSEFFGRLRDIIGKRTDIQIVGDRFVFQAEVLFEVGDDQLSEAGKTEIAKLARELLKLGRRIPQDINWVLRVDGHTDARPIVTAQFASNWELSVARAISVVKYLITQGIPANRLMAAGFGEFQPITRGETEQDYASNRRIELKLTER